MADSFIPAPDGLALTWFQTFAAGLSASPGTYGLGPADAANITAAVDAYAAAYAVALDPAQRTKVAVSNKDATRANAEALCRQVASLIKYNNGISDSDKVAVGVRPVNPSRSPINVPASSPLLNVIGATPGSQTVRYADSNSPDRPAKPFGAAQIQVFVAVGTAPVADPDTAQFYGAFTKNPIAVGFDPADDGKVATYFARWASRRGDVGPWSRSSTGRVPARATWPTSRRWRCRSRSAARRCRARS